MVSVTDAARAATAVLVEMESKGARPLVVTNLVRHRNGWVAYFNSRRYLETGAWTDLLGGNGPIAISDDESIQQVRSSDEAVALLGEPV